MASENPLEPYLQKIRYYCSYQERSHREVKEKLYSFGLRKQQVEGLLSQMIEEDYLNEQRFAVTLARGKLRMNHWGRIKIKQALKAKQVSEYNMNLALRSIDENEYMTILKKTAEKYSSRLKGGTAFMRKQKLIQSLLSKGFEMKAILETLDAPSD